MDLSIIIINYKTDKYLEGCFSSLQKLTDIEYEIILINNSPLKIKEIPNSSKIKIINNHQNIGFARASNQGAQISKGKYLLFLNPDTEYIKGNFIELFDFYEKKNVGIIGFKLLNYNNTVQHSARSFPIFWHLILKKMHIKHFYGKYHLVPLSDKIIPIDWVSGAALFISKDKFEKLGYFDETFFLYFEDVDLCKKSKLKGWTNYYYSKIEFFHYHRRNSANIFSVAAWHHFISAIKYFKKNGNG